MKRPLLLWLSGMAAVLAGCSPPASQPTSDQGKSTVPTMPTKASAALDPKAVITMSGPAGSVALGDPLEKAKQVYPLLPGAKIRGAANFAIFHRDGWTWMLEKPEQAFEVSLKEGKIVGIVQTLVEPNAATRKTLLEQAVEKVGPPSAKAEGKTATIYAWDVKPNARFMIEMEEMLGSQPLVMTMIGEQDELKRFNYRVDDVATLVQQMDMTAEAVRQQNGKSDGTGSPP